MVTQSTNHSGISYHFEQCHFSSHIFWYYCSFKSINEALQSNLILKANSWSIPLLFPIFKRKKWIIAIWLRQIITQRDLAQCYSEICLYMNKMSIYSLYATIFTTYSKAFQHKLKYYPKLPQKLHISHAEIRPIGPSSFPNGLQFFARSLFLFYKWLAISLKFGNLVTWQ